MSSLRLPFITLVGLGTHGIAAPAVDPEFVPRSDEVFERRQLAEIPAYHRHRRAEGSHQALAAVALVAELRRECGGVFAPADAAMLSPGGPRISVGIGLYSTVDHVWFGRFLGWYQHELSVLGLRFRHEGWDCDDFSLALSVMADLALLRAGEPATQPLIGRLIVFQRYPWADVPAGGLHELVIFRSERGWWVAEPQNGTIGALCFYPNRRLIQEILLN